MCIVDLFTLTKSQLSELASCMDIYYLMFALLYFLYPGQIITNKWDTGFQIEIRKDPILTLMT